MQTQNPDMIHSSKKAAKAARKLVRQRVNAEANEKVQVFAKQLNEQLGKFNEILKPRPKWVHRRLWRWFGSFFVDIDKLEQLFRFKG